MSRIFETQNQVVIRFPEQVAARLHSYFDSGGTQIPMPSLEIELDRDRRQVDKRIALKVRVDDHPYKATVMELPTITSTFKTLDRINFIKSNDISEIIIVHGEDDD